MQDVNKIYTDDEQRILDKNRRVRNLMVDALTDNGASAPSSTKDFRILNEILSASDTDIHSGAATRVKQEASANATAMRDMVLTVLDNISRTKSAMTPRNVLPAISDNDIPDLVPGETDINPGTLNAADFIIDGGEYDN